MSLNMSFIGGLGNVVKAIPGEIAHAVSNEYHQATEHPGNELQRIGGHIFNAGSDIVGMVGNTIGASENASMHAVAQKVGQVTGHPGLENKIHYIPEATMPKLDTTPGHKVWQGGSENYHPKIGTLWSAGAYVPGDAEESINRTINLVGTAALGAEGAGVGLRSVAGAARGGAAVREATNIAKNAAAESAVEGGSGTAVRQATRIAKNAAKADTGVVKEATRLTKADSVSGDSAVRQATTITKDASKGYEGDIGGSAGPAPRGPKPKGPTGGSNLKYGGQIGQNGGWTPRGSDVSHQFKITEGGSAADGGQSDALMSYQARTNAEQAMGGQVQLKVRTQPRLGKLTHHSDTATPDAAPASLSPTEAYAPSVSPWLPVRQPHVPDAAPATLQPTAPSVLPQTKEVVPSPDWQMKTTPKDTAIEAPKTAAQRNETPEPSLEPAVETKPKAATRTPIDARTPVEEKPTPKPKPKPKKKMNLPGGFATGTDSADVAKVY